MSRSGIVYVQNLCAGVITELEDGTYRFQYVLEYLKTPQAQPVSLTLPLRLEPYDSKVLMPFFDGLIPEGWLLDLAVKNWKIHQQDRMGLLLEVCGDCIGAVHIQKVPHDG